MADYKKQHFVPQFYLKSFSADGRCVMLYNIERKYLVEKTAIRSQCYSDYFYGTDGIEQLLSNLESLAAKMFREVKEVGPVALMGGQHHILLPIFVMVLLHRTLAFQMSLTQMLYGIREDLSEEVLSDAAKRTLDSMPEAIPAQSVIQAVKLAPYISDLAVTVLHSSDSSAFITSDNPVIMINPFLATERPVGSSTGYFCKGLVIYVPIAPHTAILFYDSEAYHIPATTNGAALTCTVEDVETLNQLMYTNAHQNLYSMGPSTLYTNTSECIRRESFVEVDRSTLIETGSSDELNNMITISKVDVRLNRNLSFLIMNEDARQTMIDNMRNGARFSFYRDDERHRKLESALEEHRHMSFDEYLSLFKTSKVV